MKKLLCIVFVWLCFVGTAGGGTLGDVNADGAVGLQEAIHALQVTSGIRPQGVTPNYDMADYFYVAGASYTLMMTYYSSTTATPYTYQGTSSVVQEVVDGKELLLIGTDYYQINPEGVWYAGYKSGSETRWFSPPVRYGSRAMSQGDVFTTYYVDPANPGTLNYREYTFVGIEDVTVPAGTFTGCLKFLTTLQTPTYTRKDVAHYARGVGMIKRERLTSPFASSSGSVSWSGYKQELAEAKIGTSVFPANTVFYSGNGAWQRTVSGTPGASGVFTWNFSLPNLPAWGTLILYGLYQGISYPDSTITFVSQDGIHFTPYVPPGATGTGDFEITVSGGTISGAWNTPANETVVTLNGTYSALP
jgi:hypothetical protein